ncbi:hypothetical protein BS47DRAFT_1339202 [Hydnum rufescens UP504]|uniref:Thioesterase domain-containing protein n=1 Tax=Hydnum rufescens UP504 TaxID=1448309 RepID=A0A9P6E050_9AGAM|nr:hypothetical protein BS47DRAFT_1339202 [Hydnum rufescens UP504]
MCDETEQFGREAARELKVVSVDANPQLMGKKKEVVAVFEFVVQKSMCNMLSILHGGCTATIFDIATSLPIPLFMDYADDWLFTGITSSLSLNYFLPGIEGERLRVVCTTKAGSKRTVTVVGELWSSRGLVASAVHVKMARSAGPQPKL